MIRDARERGLTLAEVAQNYAANRSHNLVVGTPQFIADQMQQWLEEEASDGFNLMPAYMPGGLDDFSNKSSPSCNDAGCSAANTAATPCATTWACTARPGRSPSPAYVGTPRTAALDGSWLGPNLLCPWPAQSSRPAPCISIPAP